MPKRVVKDVEVARGYKALANKATFVNKAVSVPDTAVVEILGELGQKKVYFRALLAIRATQVILKLVPSFDSKCATRRLKSWRVNTAGRRLYISSVTILRTLKLTEEEAQDSVLPFDIKDGSIQIPFPRKVDYT